MSSSLGASGAGFERGRRAFQHRPRPGIRSPRRSWGAGLARRRAFVRPAQGVAGGGWPSWYETSNMVPRAEATALGI